jgi:type II secretory pathway pseudopilin PulG
VTPEAVGDRVAREDLVLFVAAAFACTRQGEFYTGAEEQGLSLSLLHDYVLGNYRRWYARTLALGINHLNRTMVLERLLAAGAPADAEARAEENGLLRAGLLSLPPQRAWRLLAGLGASKTNNRRSRALLRAWMSSRDMAFDAVKYRALVRRAVRHAHLKVDRELGTFLFTDASRARFDTPLFETWRRAHFAKEALYDLPFTVAEGFAARHGEKRNRFLRRIQPKMTAGERLRLLGSAGRRDVALDVALDRVTPTRLALYLMSLSDEARRERADELTEALARSATRVARRTGLRLPRVAAVLDASFSSSGTREKRRRPLGVALATSALLRAASDDYRAFWAPTLSGPEVCVRARGMTALVDGVIAALRWDPDLLVIVSDGHENDVAGATSAAIAAWRRFSGSGATVVHLNPVFDAQHFSPRPLGTALPTLGLRDAEDLSAVLPFVRFATGAAHGDVLDAWLGARARAFVEAA